MRNSPTPEAPIAAAAWASDRLLMLASSSIVIAVGGDGRLIAVFGQVILEIEETRAAACDRRLSLPESGLTITCPSRPSTTIDVAGLDRFEDAAHAGDGRNAAAAGQDGRVAGLAAGLRDDAGHLALAQRRRPATAAARRPPGSAARLIALAASLRLKNRRKMAAEPHDHVAHVGQSLAEVLIAGAGKQADIFLQDLVAAQYGAVWRSSTIQRRILAVKAGSCRIDSWAWKMAASGFPTWVATLW